MSIVERLAEFLGPMARPEPKSPASAGRGEVHGSDLIERVVGEGTQLEERGPAGGATARARPAEHAGRTSRAIKIDANRLRQENMIAPGDPRSHITESFRRIKRQILANLDNPKDGVPANLLMVTSALPGEGKTFCTVNLALSIALELDRTVLLVDADVAKPRVPEVLGFEAEKGLMDVLLDRRIDLADVLCRTDIDKLSILPAGTAHQHATELLASHAMRALMREMASRYRDRIVVFDSPPLLAASEASALANQMGQIIMVVEAGNTTEAALKEALGRIESSNVAGLLLNKGRGPKPGYYGGYGYGAR